MRFVSASKANAGGGAATTLTAADIGVDPQAHHHRVVVDAALAPFKVEMRVPTTGVWVELANDMAATDEALIDAYGYDAIRVTCDGAAGNVHVQALDKAR